MTTEPTNPTLSDEQIEAYENDERRERFDDVPFNVHFDHTGPNTPNTCLLYTSPSPRDS